MSAATNLTPDDDGTPVADENAGTKEAKPNLFGKTETALVLLEVHENPVVVFSKPESLEALYASLEREVDEFVPDLSTPTTRKKITSFAYKLTRTRTAIDAAGKDLNAAKRAEINAVDEVRRSMRDRIDTLIEKAEQPLKDWENAEKHRKEQIERDLGELRNAGMIFNDDTLDDLEARLAKLESMVVDPDTFGTFATEADGRRRQAIVALQNGIERIKKAEAEARELEASRAELAQLREMQAASLRREQERAEAERIANEEAARNAREKADQEAREKAEDERAAREAEQRERDRSEAEERMKDAAEAAEKRAREDAEREKRELEEKHAAELRRIKEAAAQKERDRLAEEKRQRDALEAADRAGREAEEKRQADKRHRSKVMGEVRKAMLAALPMGGSLLSPADTSIVDDIVEAIAAGKVIHTAIQF